MTALLRLMVVGTESLRAVSRDTRENKIILEINRSVSSVGITYCIWVTPHCVRQSEEFRRIDTTKSPHKMAPTKRSSSDSKARSSASQYSLQKVKGENFYRNAKQVKRLKMLSGGKAVRDRDGKIIQAAAFQKGEDETTPGRVQPDRRWFGASLTCRRRPRLTCSTTLSWSACFFFAGNTRVISQTALDHFRTSLQTKQHDPYSVLLRRNKLPMQLLDDAANPNLRKVRIVLNQPILHRLTKPSAALSYRRDRAIRGNFWSQGSTQAPAHRCWHVRGAWQVGRGRCRRSCTSKGDGRACGSYCASSDGADTCRLHRADIREGHVATHIWRAVQSH